MFTDFRHWLLLQQLSSSLFVYKGHGLLWRLFYAYMDIKSPLSSLQSPRTWVFSWPSVQHLLLESCLRWCTRTGSLSPLPWPIITQAPTNGETWALILPPCTCVVWFLTPTAPFSVRSVHLSNCRRRRPGRRSRPAVWWQEPRNPRHDLRKPNPAAGGRAVGT